ncbi:MAG: hypothetical protein WBW13_24515, partial [Pseudolabrys sp.]
MTVTWQDFEATEVQNADTSIFLRRFGSGSGVCSETEEAAPFQERVLGNLPLTLASLLQHECWPHVRFGSLADICGAKRDVRFTPNSGHSAAVVLRLLVSWRKAIVADGDVSSRINSSRLPTKVVKKLTPVTFPFGRL